MEGTRPATQPATVEVATDAMRTRRSRTHLVVSARGDDRLSVSTMMTARHIRSSSASPSRPRLEIGRLDYVVPSPSRKGTVALRARSPPTRPHPHREEFSTHHHLLRRRRFRRRRLRFRRRRRDCAVVASDCAVVASNPTVVASTNRVDAWSLTSTPTTTMAATMATARVVIGPFAAARATRRKGSGMNPPPAIQSPSTPPRRRSKPPKSPHAPPPVERIADSFANASAVSSRSAASEEREVSASAFASPVSTSPRAPGEDFGRSDAETASASASSSGSSASAWSRRGSPRDANMLSSCFAAAPRAGSHPMPPRNPPAAPVASSCVWRSAGGRMRRRRVRDG